MPESQIPTWLTEEDGLLKESLKRGYITQDNLGNINIGEPPPKEEHEAFQLFYLQLWMSATSPWN